MKTCAKEGCTARTFMSSDRCFDHQQMHLPGWFKAWFVFCFLVGVAMLGCAGWAVFSVVGWVTSQ